MGPGGHTTLKTRRPAPGWWSKCLCDFSLSRCFWPPTHRVRPGRFFNPDRLSAAPGSKNGFQALKKARNLRGTEIRRPSKIGSKTYWRGALRHEFRGESSRGDEDAPGLAREKKKTSNNLKPRKSIDRRRRRTSKIGLRTLPDVLPGQFFIPGRFLRSEIGSRFVGGEIDEGDLSLHAVRSLAWPAGSHGLRPT